jgi:hypothetical protein
MAVKHDFQYAVPEGKTFISLYDWVHTLTVAEQQEYADANERQLGFRQAAIESGDLILDESDPINPSYVWKDEATAARGKPTDPIWKTYWERYIRETGIEFNIANTTV